MGNKRVEYAITDKQPLRVVALVGESRCNSDDDSGTDEDGGAVYFVNGKNIRSASATSFIHNLEDRHLNLARGMTRRRHANLVERRRVRIPNAPESDISFQFPKSVPIDWFNPTVFNDLPAKIRAGYFDNGVALPLLAHHNNVDWKTMDRDAFMAKYGDDVLALYNVPTEEEMAEEGNTGWEENDEDRSQSMEE